MRLLEMLGDLHGRIILVGFLIVSVAVMLTILSAPPEASQNITATAITVETNYFAEAVKDIVIFGLIIAVIGAFFKAIKSLF